MMATSEVVLRFDAIIKRFGRLVANDAVSLSLHRAGVVALLEENGAGMTTLMNIVFGGDTASRVSVQVFGQTLPPGNARAARDAMVHQHFTLADNLTVLENIAPGVQSLNYFHFKKV